MTALVAVTAPGDHLARPAAGHDSDAWETISGWIWSCRTCLASGSAGSEEDAQAKRARHDARPVPWWVERFNGSQR